MKPITEEELPGHSKAPVPIKILTYDEMLAMPEPDFLVFGVVPRRGKTCLFGVSNSFKTFIAVDLGGSVSTGKTYHGMATRKCKTFYVANEGAAGVGRKRIAAWMAYHDIPQADRRNIFLITVETILPNETSRNNLIAGIRQLVEPGEDFFIIFDVHRGTMSGPDKDDEAVDAWIKAAEILIVEGATIFSITHSPYSDDTRARGSSHVKAKKRGPSPKQKSLLLEVIAQAIDEAWVSIMPFADAPAIKAVPDRIVRDRYYLRHGNVEPDDKKEGKHLSVAFYRTLKNMIDRMEVLAHPIDGNRHIWLP